MIAEISQVDGVRDGTPMVKLVAAYLAEVDQATYDEIVEAVGVSKSSVGDVVDILEDADVVRKGEKQTDRRGRNPTLAIATGDLARLKAGVDGDDEGHDLEAEVIAALARAHYQRGISTQKARRIGAELGVSAHKASAILRGLEEAGAVESFERSTTNYYRLVDPDDFAPFYAPTEEEVEA